MRRLGLFLTTALTLTKRVLVLVGRQNWGFGFEEDPVKEIKWWYWCWQEALCFNAITISISPPTIQATQVLMRYPYYLLNPQLN